MRGSVKALGKLRTLDGVPSRAAIGCVLAAAASVAAVPAKAQQECGAPVDGRVTCTIEGNPYPAGITYDATDDLTVAINDGVEVRDSVSVRSFGGVRVSNDGDIVTAGDAASGLAVAGSGLTTLTGVGTITTTGGDAHGIDLRSEVNFFPTNGGIAVRYDGDVTTGGSGATGVLADKGRGTGDIDLALSGDVTTRGEGANGVLASTDGGSIIIRSTGTITTYGDGAFSFPISRSGGIVALAGGNVDVAAADVVTAGARSVGIMAVGGAQTVVTAGTVRTSGENASGIVASANGGFGDPQNPPIIPGQPFPDPQNPIPPLPSPDSRVTVTAADVVVTGRKADAIIANAGGAVTVVAGRATATNGVAIRATSVFDATGVTLTGNASSGVGPAIVINAGTQASLELGANASLTSAGGGATLTSVQGSTVTNAGSIVGDGAAPVIAATGGRLMFVNRGRFTGRIGFTGGDDAVDNSGTYRASFDQDFGDGSDVFANSGRLLVLPTATAPGMVAFTGLERFANSGLIDLRNGHAGDTLTLSGDYAGSGDAALAIELGSGQAIDRLTVAGAITGTTRVTIVALDGGPAPLNPGTTFASGGAGSGGDAFVLANGPATDGLIRYAIAFDPASGGYRLIGTPGDSVFRTLKITEGAQLLWHKSADSWSAHMAELRDRRVGDPSGRIWGQMFGEVDRRRDRTVRTTFGTARPVDTTFRQDAFGGQLGVDFGSGATTFGLTGGYLDSSATFRGSADRAQYRVINGGGYAGIAAGPFFASALGKVDYVMVRAVSAGGGLSDRFHGFSYGVQGEAGLRLGGDRIYAQPLVTLAYTRTDLDDLRARGGTIDFDRFDGLRGKAGLRLVATRDRAGGAVSGYAQGAYVHEFEGKDGITFASGGTTVGYRNRPLGDYAEAKAGFSVATPGGVTGFVEGFGDIGSTYRGGGGRAGLRLRL